MRLAMASFTFVCVESETVSRKVPARCRDFAQQRTDVCQILGNFQEKSIDKNGNFWAIASRQRRRRRVSALTWSLESFPRPWTHAFSWRRQQWPSRRCRRPLPGLDCQFGRGCYSSNCWYWYVPGPEPISNLLPSFLNWYVSGYWWLGNVMVKKQFKLKHCN